MEDAATVKRPRPLPGLAPHSDALTIALDERVHGDDVGIHQEKSHPSLDDGSAIDGVVVGVRDADPAPGVHAGEQSQAAAMPHHRCDEGRCMVVVLPTRRGPC